MLKQQIYLYLNADTKHDQEIGQAALDFSLRILHNQPESHNLSKKTRIS